jgi:hypothetical protein
VSAEPRRKRIVVPSIGFALLLLVVPLALSSPAFRVKLRAWILARRLRSEDAAARRIFDPGAQCALVVTRSGGGERRVVSAPLTEDDIEPVLDAVKGLSK